MPQLDTVTFLSQIFWLVIIFGFFYLIVLTHILPAISRILKVRKKKLEHNKNAMYALGDEKGDTLTGYDKILSQGLEVSRNSLAKSSQLGDAWVSSSLKDINKEGSMLNSNTSYLNAFGNIIGSKHVIKTLYTKK
jgi:F-type H+-transporting ATPase subunit b